MEIGTIVDFMMFNDEAWVYLHTALDNLDRKRNLDHIIDVLSRVTDDTTTVHVSADNNLAVGTLKYDRAKYIDALTEQSKNCSTIIETELSKILDKISGK